ncbi:MAG: thiamine diphosphokinase [Clostridiales bacterium]|nr:thiamine diphosphokinase [Clostridiales bacterium]
MRSSGSIMKWSNQNKRILILTGGYVSDRLLKALTGKEQYSFIIAADKGLSAAKRIGLVPDYIIGDFDSVPSDVLSEYKEKGVPVETFPSMKDKTDTHIALDMAIGLEPLFIDIVGATGSRMDHAISNIELLINALKRNIKARILDENNCIYLKDKSFSIKKSRQYGNFISLLPFSNRVTGLKLVGFKYPLNGITLDKGISLGISNELIADEGIVEFDEGILTVIESRD